MFYVINVSYKGKHFFATAEHSLLDYDAAYACFCEIKNRFPEAEGYKVECTQWVSAGERMAW